MTYSTPTKKTADSCDRLREGEPEAKTPHEEPRKRSLRFKPNSDKLTDHLPTEKDDGETITQFDGDQLEELGLLKIDVLGLKTLRTIRIAKEIAEDRQQKQIPEEDLEARDDPEVYEKVFATGDTRGIFQFKSDGMREMLADMKPKEFDHIVAMNALYRPGPMKLIPDFIDRMHGEEEVKYLHPSVHEEIKDDVADILDDTYGIMVFQEQIMQVCQRLAGFSLGEADIMRRAVGKKKRKLLEKQQDKFVQGCKQEGYSESLGEQIFELIEEFADYGFNRCVTGDTKLMGNDETVAEMCEALKAGENHDTTAYSMDNSEEIVENEILLVAPQGRQPVYEVTLEGMHISGQGPFRTIRVTGNHKFPVGKSVSAGTSGYIEKRVDEMEESDSLFVLPEKWSRNLSQCIEVGIYSIRFVGTEEVYDVTMKCEPNNFVTEEGIVTSNSHAAAYSALAYKQAYFKAHHPTAFFTAAVRTEDDEDEQAGLIQDAKRHGVDVLPPSVNESGHEFTPIPGKEQIRFGLGTIKGVGKQAQKIIDERESGGQFASYRDFIERAIPNMGAVRNLIKAGALDEFDLSRKAMFEQMEDLLDYARKLRNHRRGDRVSKPECPEITDCPEWPHQMRFEQERDVAGIYTTGQPIDRFPTLVESFDGEEYRRKSARYGASDYRVRCGSILSVSQAETKNGNPMWWVRFMTGDGVSEEPVFQWRYDSIRNNLETDVAVLIVSKADTDGEYAGMYSIENVVPMRQIGRETSQVPQLLRSSTGDLPVHTL